MSVQYNDVLKAETRLKGVTRHTPLLENPFLNEMLEGRLFIKPECLQETGSFKLRGAFNRLSALSQAEKAAGVVAFSSGNHAQGVARAAQILGVEAVIVMPSDAPTLKIENTRKYGADLYLYDQKKENREEIARRISSEKGMVLVPSFDDPYIVAGQGTVGLEAGADLKKANIQLDQAVFCCGGGGLASGSFLALKEVFPDMACYTAEPDDFDDTKRSLECGERCGLIGEGKSICDALLSPMPGAIPFELLMRMGTKGLTVSDAEVRTAMMLAARELKLVVEPGGAVALAAVLAGKIKCKGRNTLIILSGGNVDTDSFASYIHV